MIEFPTFRDAEASLWQSAVDEAVARRQETAAAPLGARGLAPSPHPNHPFARAAAFAGALITALKTFQPAGPSFAPPEALPAAADQDPTHFGVFVADLARRFPDEAEFRSALEHTRFSRLDPLWIEAALNYHRNLQRHREGVPYRNYEHLEDFVIPKTLPDRARVALVSDWGTGTPEALAVLQHIAARNPDCVVHLGDIYYAGLEREVQGRFLEPWTSTLDLDKVLSFSLAGNHDMYSGGKPYYELIDRLGQPASYFCLRNQHWQFIAMDTGRNSGLKHKEATFLQETEVAWVRDKLENAGGRKTILLSHHPLFSAYETIGDDPDGVNHTLLHQVEPLLTPATQVRRWFWGHEHRLTIYRESHGVTARCVGHGAIPVSDAQQPRQQAGVDIPTVEEVQLGKSGEFYNHGYALIELNGPSATARYFQVGGEPEQVFEESF